MRPVNIFRNFKDTETAHEAFLHKSLINTTAVKADNASKQISASSQLECDFSFDDLGEKKK